MYYYLTMANIGTQPPSQEFLALQENSQLPEWIVHEQQLEDHWLLMMGGTHGDEQDQVEFVRERMSQDTRIPGVLPVIAHRVAALTGLRSLYGNQQLMAWYPGKFDGEAVEDRIAAGITWLTGKLATDHLVIDRHD